MNDLPKSWKFVPIHDLTTYVQRGKSPRYAESSDLPVINQKCIRWSGVDGRFLKFVAEEQWRSWGEDRTLRKGDILWNSTGTGTIGRAALFSELPHYQRVVADSHVTVVRVNAAVEPAYLLNYIKSPSVQSRINDMQTGSTNQVELGRKEVLDTIVPLAPIAEQRRITAKIDGLSAKSKRARDRLSHVSRLAVRYKGAVLDAAFLGKLSPKIDEATEASSKATDKSGAMARWQLPRLPSRWTWVEVVDVAAVTGGLTKNTKRESLSKRVPYLRVANVYANRLALEEIAEIGCTETEFERTRLMAGDLLIVEGNGSRDQIGRVAIWDGQIEGCSHQNHLIRARVGRDCLSEYLLYWMLAPLGRSFIEEVASSSSGLHTLSISKVQSLPLPLCSVREQKQIVGRIRGAFAWIDRLAAEAISARALVDRLDQAILAKAFRGELVPQDLADEPASVLLERIRAERVGAPAARRRGRPRASALP